MTFTEVLEHFGCDQVRLRKIFTTDVPYDQPQDLTLDVNVNEIPQPPKSDGEINRRFRNRIRSRTLDGISTNLRAARPNQAVDLALDAPPIQRHTIPLMMWAQGKLTLQTAYTNLCGTAGTAQADKFFRKETLENKEVLRLNENRITDVVIDLAKSYMTRMHGGLDALWSNLWPLMKFDPRGTDDVAQLRADALTQRVDIIADQYNYRHFFSQCRRQMLAYGYSVAFPRAAWDRQTNWQPKRGNTGEPTKGEFESVVVREGVDFVNPHPSRIFYDLSAPLANINTDTGPSYIGYWDVVPWRTLLESNNQFFNLNNIFVTNGWTNLASTYGEFFGYYFDPCVMNWPECQQPDPSLGNDIKANVGRYTSQMTDVGILVTHYFERINPLREGIGKYDSDVWIHLTVGGDCTVLAAEFMPSIPACYGGININDGRLANQSAAMALLAYQDWASNIFSSSLMQLRTSLIQLWLIDKDSLDEDVVAAFRTNAKDADWWVDRKVLIYSASKLRDQGIMDPRQAFGVVQSQVSNVFDNCLKELTQLLSLADRLLILSPNELGQPNPREVAAREVTEIAGSVQAINAFRNEGPREQMGAAKQLIYESLLTRGTQRFRVPVEKRYTKDVIKRAGFQIPEDVKVPEGQEYIPTHTPLMGNLRDLQYDYYFTSRDGAERVVNTQGAQVVMQLLQGLLLVPALASKIPLSDLMDMANLVIRMSGAPVNFQFEMPPGMDDGQTLPQGDPKSDQVIASVQQQLQRIEQIMMQVMKLPQGTFPPAPGSPGQPGQPGAAPPQGGPPPGSPGAPAPAAAPGGESMLSDPSSAPS